MDKSNNNMMYDIDDSATLILNVLGCENMKEDVLELDILSHLISQRPGSLPSLK